MKIAATLFYPGGFHIKEKRIELTHMELQALSMSNKVLSEERCFHVENKVFHVTKDGTKEIRIILGECY